MKENELRIGNLVYFTHPDEGQLISSIEKIESETHLNWNGYGSIISVVNGISYFDCYKNQISGIPLSEEILLKCGFKSISDIHPTFRLSRFIVEENVMKDGYTFRIAINNQESVQIIKIKYLHQLQNLYFALKGTELDTSKIL